MAEILDKLFEEEPMKKFSFHDLPPHYESMKATINDKIIRKMYEKFTFSYFKYQIEDEIQDSPHNAECENNFEDFLLNYLNEFKFIVYNIDIQNTSNIDDQNDINNPKSISIHFCTEGKCFIIENVLISKIENVINRLKKQNKSVIKVVSNILNSNTTKEEYDTNDDIINFCLNFEQEIKNNSFLSSTIPVLSCYLIRRFFYPTDYFKDKSFLIFNPQLQFNENDSKLLLNTIINDRKLTDYDDINRAFIDFSRSTRHFLQLKKTVFQDFKKEEFIVLKTIKSNDKESYKLVFHIESFYIFMMKEFSSQEGNQNEIDFCENFSHRCLTHFYGFLKDDDKKNGIIYEFMCNGTLQSLIESQKEISKMKSISIICRIFQCIQFFNIKSIIHTNLNPSNILFDRDFIPYLSFNNNDSNETDIYSFGKIIYSIFEKKNYNNETKIKNASNKIQNIFDICIKKSANKAKDLSEIRKILIDEVDSISYFENELLNESINEDNSDLIQFIQESFIILLFQIQDTLTFIKNFYVFKSLYILKRDRNYSDFYLKMGHQYANGSVFTQDYLKAKELYEKSSKFNNAEAFGSIGALYSYGCGVEQSDSKAKEYYEKSAELGEPNSLYSLGRIYYKGRVCEKNYAKAIECFEKSAKLNNSSSLLALGNIYLFGKAVEKNVLKAIEYYEKAANMNNKNAIISLGELYERCKNYKKAKIYYEKAIKLGCDYALINLGNLYEKGLGVEKDYSAAKQLYELSAKCKNPIALLNLGKLYLYGLGVKKDYSKGLELISQSASLKSVDACMFFGKLYLDNDNKKSFNFFKMASELNCADAFYMMGYFYSNGLICNIDMKMAVDCYLKCIEIGQSYNEICSDVDETIHYISCSSEYRDQSYNDLGLIYLLNEQNVDEASKYLKEAAQNESPIGLNNYGLLNQFYLNNTKESECLYEKASSNKFTLSEFNLGFLKEKERKIDESIKLYKKAADNEYAQICSSVDKQLEISKVFILCFTNLKLAEFYFSHHEIEESKKYFVKSLNYIALLNFFYGKRFHFNYKKGKNPFLFLRDFIFNLPLFNLQNQKNLGFNLKFTLTIISILNSSMQSEVANDEIKLNNPMELFDFLTKNSEYQNRFSDEIKDILGMMEKVLYTHPYPILFGKMNIYEI